MLISSERFLKLLTERNIPVATLFVLVNVLTDNAGFKAAIDNGAVFYVGLDDRREQLEILSSTANYVNEAPGIKITQLFKCLKVISH